MEMVRVPKNKNCFKIKKKYCSAPEMSRAFEEQEISCKMVKNTYCGVFTNVLPFWFHFLQI
jgi:hypothetical protein